MYIFAGPSGFEAYVMTRSLLNKRSFFSFVGTLRRQITLPAEGPNPLGRPLGAPWIDFSQFLNQIVRLIWALSFGCRCVGFSFVLNSVLASLFVKIRNHRNLMFCSMSNGIPTFCISRPSYLHNQV